MYTKDPWDEFRQLPPLLTVQEVATLLRVTVKAVYSRKERGQLAGVISDGARGFLVRKSALLRSLLQQGRAPSRTDGDPG